MNYVDDEGLLKSPFYRVASRVVVRDKAGRLLVVLTHDGQYELPGGGWEHTETFEESVRREVWEELGVDTKRVGDLLFAYRGRYPAYPHVMLRLAVAVELADHDFTINDDVVASARFVDRDEFLALDWSSCDKEILEHINKLWPRD